MNLKNNNQLHFEPVNSENRREAENLSVFSEQSGFVSMMEIYWLALRCTAIFLPLFRDGYGWIGC